MKKLNHLLFFISISSVLFLGGCIQVVQDVSVAEDGTGTMLFAIGVDADAYPQFEAAVPDGYQLENLFATLIQDENISDVQQEQYSADGRIWNSLTLKISDFTNLFEEERRIGPLVISLDDDGGVFTYSQIIDVAGSNLDIPGINLLDVSGASYRIRLSSPQIIDTTGLQSSVGVSEWEIPLEELLLEDETIFIQAEYSLSPYEGLFIPWEVFFPYVVIGFLAIGGLSILIVIFINTRKREEEIPQIKF